MFVHITQEKAHRLLGTEEMADLPSSAAFLLLQGAQMSTATLPSRAS